MSWSAAKKAINNWAKLYLTCVELVSEAKKQAAIAEAVAEVYKE